MSALIPTTASSRASRVLAAFAASLVFVAAGAIAPPVLAQDQSAQQAPQFSPEQLDQLVAPIALYPDNLLGQILTASTYPLEAVMAARWCQANPNVKGPALESAMQQENWDPSIKALTSVPQVLEMMNDKLDWTQQVGDAYLSDPDGTAAAIQRLRLKAQAAGNLQTNAQQRVSYVPAPQPIIIDGAPQPNYVVIEPVDPAVLYVPIYNPVVVYGPWAYPAYRPFFWSPPGFVFGVGVIAFGAPFVVGPAIWATYDWRSRHVDIDVLRFNRFNHTSLAANGPGNKLLWEHDPGHRGNLPYNNAVLQQKFSKGITTNASVNPNQKLNLGNTGITGNNNNNKGGNNNQIRSFDKPIITNNGGNNNNNNNNNTRLNTTIRTDEHHDHVDLKNNNTGNNPPNNAITHTNANITSNVLKNNNPPPPPPPPHNNQGSGVNKGGQNNEKDKKHIP